MPQTSPSKGNVEVDGSGGDRLLQAGIVIRLCQVDPVDLGTGVGLPGLQEATEQHIVQVLVVEAHECEFDTGELTLLDVGLGCVEAEFTDLLEVSVRWLTFADTGNLQDFRAQLACCRSWTGEGAKTGA